MPKKVNNLKLTPQVLELNWDDVAERIKNFIKDYVERVGAEGIVLGISGGVDSSTAAALSALAIGGEKVLGLIMPEEETYNPKDIEDAKRVAEKFGIKTEIIDLSKVLKAFYNTIPVFNEKNRISKGNIKARTRMICIYYYANAQKRIVVGSSDKSETMMGYFTKWGDVAADISPLMDLYKTQVRKLALHIGMPKEIALKPSTPALWPNQTAEQELGIKYEILDLILYGLERFMKSQEIASQLNLPVETIERVKAQWIANEHKRRMPLTIKIQYRTAGADFRLPRT